MDLERVTSENRDSILALREAVTIKLDEVVVELRNLNTVLINDIRDLAKAMSGRGMIDIKTHFYVVLALIAFFFLDKFGVNVVSKLIGASHG